MQNVLFISVEKPAFYPVIDKHYTWVPLHGELTYERLSETWHDTSPLAVVTYGDGINWKALNTTLEIQKRWVHLDTLPEEIPYITNTIMTAALDTERWKKTPLVSIFTTTFNSGDKILRPLRSLQGQSYSNWEWILWDDSKDTATYERLLEMQKKDLRIHVYRAPRHSSVIGEMKRRAAGLARGEYVVEVDHDDDLHQDLLKWIVDAGNMYPDAGFFYSDCSELTERSYKSVSYGEFFAFGHSAHFHTWSPLHKKYVIIATEPAPNPKTISYIVGVPNHVRAWRTSFYDRIGKHNPFMSVADDYELLVRSYMHGKWCHIRKCGYYQYRNEDGNFTFIRNSLIQHNTKNIYQHYASKLPKPIEEKTPMPAWRYEGDLYPKIHYTYDPEPYTTTVAMIDPTREEIEKELKRPDCRLAVLGPRPDIPDEWKPRVDWWDVRTATCREDKIRYARKFMHCGKEFVVVSTVADRAANKK